MLTSGQHTNIQIRRETQPMFFATYILTVSDYNGLATCLRALGPGLADSLTDVRVRMWWKEEDLQAEAGGRFVAAIASREIRAVLSKRKLFVKNARIYVRVYDRVTKYWSDGGMEEIGFRVEDF